MKSHHTTQLSLDSADVGVFDPEDSKLSLVGYLQDNLCYYPANRISDIIGSIPELSSLSGRLRLTGKTRAVFPLQSR